ncbi:MAG: hypothetical protein WCL27_14885 [Betaproteobacteria bacterium]
MPNILMMQKFFWRVFIGHQCKSSDENRPVEDRWAGIVNSGVNIVYVINFLTTEYSGQKEKTGKS